jgi:cell division protein ZapA (FtsZ GTPase activity inhibitor)
MSRTRRITVKIAGKEYAMTVPQDDEEKYRRAAREINELISAYKGSFVAEPEDYLAMAAMQVAVNKGPGTERPNRRARRDWPGN